MSILKYLPKFKVVEINRSTGLIAGHLLSNYQLDPTTDFIRTINEDQDTGDQIRFIENGFILGLNEDLVLEPFVLATHNQPFLIFTEELNTFLDALDYYATPEDADGEIYPRCLGLYVGDTFTTNNFAEAYTGQAYAYVNEGVITLQEEANSNTIFAVEDSSLPAGGHALRFTYVGPVATT